MCDYVDYKLDYDHESIPFFTLDFMVPLRIFISPSILRDLILKIGFMPNF